jgi:hypothetical protein
MEEREREDVGGGGMGTSAERNEQREKKER